ncbi:Cyb5 [Kluyveromyces lactis]|nr:Cyb5 [Kluyveromyces lactis]
MAKLLTYKEVSEHKTVDDLWMIIDGKVYDCTKFVDEHPGGDEILVDLGGQDATGPFEDIGHSDDAIKLLEPMYVGDIDTTSEPVLTQTTDMSSAATTGGEGNGLMIIALIAVFLAIAYYYFNQ